jgi:hypothetical protein
MIASQLSSSMADSCGILCFFAHIDIIYDRGPCFTAGDYDLHAFRRKEKKKKGTFDS